MTSKFINANGLMFRVKVSGKKGAPWVTFSNSLATSLAMWDGQAAAFAKDYQILQYDTRGHGQSDAPKGDYSWQDLTGDVIGLWDALGIEKSHVVGLSLGGMTGIGLALNHPKRLLSLTACDCRSDAPEMFQKMWDQRCAGIAEGGIAATVDMTLASWFTEAFRDAENPVVNQVKEMIQTTPVDGYLGCVGALRTLDFKKRLSEINMPTLFLVGESDGPHPAEMETMQALVPGASFEIIRAAAHISNMEQPDVFNAHLSTFLSTNG